MRPFNGLWRFTYSPVPSHQSSISWHVIVWRMTFLLQKKGNDSLSFLRIILKLIMIPSMGRIRPWDEICRNKHPKCQSCQRPTSNRISCPLHYFSEKVGSWYVFERSSVRDFVGICTCICICICIGRRCITESPENTVRLNVDNKSCQPQGCAYDKCWGFVIVLWVCMKNTILRRL